MFVAVPIPKNPATEMTLRVVALVVVAKTFWTCIEFDTNTLPDTATLAPDTPATDRLWAAVIVRVFVVLIASKFDAIIERVESALETTTFPAT